jgi:hypothetical protein
LISVIVSARAATPVDRRNRRHFQKSDIAPLWIAILCTLSHGM